MTGTFHPSEDCTCGGGPAPAGHARDCPLDTRLPAWERELLERADALGEPQQGWVRRAADKPKPHRCEPPRDGGQRPAGAHGDLWRCGCGALWRIGFGCPFCDRSVLGADGRCQAPGDHLGLGWRPATWWQRLRYRKAMR